MTKKKLRLMTRKLGIFSYFFHHLDISFYVVSISRYSTRSKDWLKFSIKEHSQSVEGSDTCWRECTLTKPLWNRVVLYASSTNQESFIKFQ